MSFPTDNVDIFGNRRRILHHSEGRPVPGLPADPRHSTPDPADRPTNGSDTDDEKQARRGRRDAALLPPADPNLDANETSLSGVYPPRELSNRSAISRTDGYWKYVARGERPPSEFTYGEFDDDFFGILLDKSWVHRSSDGFIDRDG